ncbi:MAG: penicillin-binding protein [Chitinophagales bacterium]|nr:penicillin-binding protein [Chitinophagales bacterium]
MSIKKDILWRIYLAFFAVCCMGFAVVIKAGKIQNVEGPALRKMSDSITTDFKPIEAERGNILSEDGRLLATSLPYFEVRMDMLADGLEPKEFSDSVGYLAAKWAAKYPEKSAEKYRQELINARRRKQRYFLIRKNVTYPELQEIKTWPLLQQGQYEGGLIVNQTNKRVLPFGNLAKRTLGYVRDSVQPIGLEGGYDKYLSGVKGKRLMQRIAGDTWVPVNEDEEISAENGKDIVTTIDINLQDVLETSLHNALIKHNADHGCAILMEVKTGKIKAIANLGKNGEDYWEDFNYAIGEATEPGSTFKLASVIALLEDGYVKPGDSVNIEGGKVAFYRDTMRDSEKHEEQKVTVQHAFEISSNVAFSKLVNHFYNNKREQYIQHLQKMGLYEKTGIAMKGEAAPYIKHPDQSNWTGTTLPWMAVGYELMLTPLQVLTLYNTVANDGYIVKPYIVKEIQQQGKPVQQFEPQVGTERICSKATLLKVQSMLEGVVLNGTGKKIKADAYSIAGKTGTAKIVFEGRYEKIYQSSFAGYFPADNPMYSCIVVVNAPSNGEYYGGVVAAPVFRELADKIYATSLALHPKNNTQQQYPAINVPGLLAGNQNDMKTICGTMGLKHSVQKDAEWVAGEPSGEGIAMNEKPVVEGQVPNVLGMGLKDAIYLLETQGLVVDFKGKGKVKQQSLAPGSTVARGQAIYIELN